MIMWMSSDWLLHEKYGRTIDSTLEKRLRHYLRLKNQYGFYEFFSSTYAPYSLSGLINLADFALDNEIKSLATTASQKLLKDLLLLTNDKGVFFPIAGRNYPEKYERAYGANHNSLIYLLTGKGVVENTTSHAGSFLATSPLPIDEVNSTWTPTLNISYTQGHSLQAGINNINHQMSNKDKVIFQWSSGAYFHPDVATSTFQTLKDLNLWQHYEFDDFRQFSGLPVSVAPVLAEIASPISKSSGLYQPTLSIFKNKSVTLSSLQDYWKGKLGYQQFPIMVNTGTGAVFTLSGKPQLDWGSRPSLHANTHLPYVQQKDNIALVMYRPEKGLALFGYKNEQLSVALHWKNELFDEIRENGNWLIGREADSYVAVRRNCTSDINGVRGCDNPDGQTWVFVVGNSEMYGSLENFQNIINQSEYEEKWYFNTPTLQWVYYSKIIIDGKKVEYAWNGDIFSGPTRVTAIKNLSKESNNLTVFPNPAVDNISIDLASFKHEKILIRIVNIHGEEVHQEIMEANNNPIKTIGTANWENGMYFILVESEQFRATKQIVIQK